MLHAAQVTPSSRTVTEFPVVISTRSMRPESRTTAMYCECTKSGFGNKARTATPPVPICCPGSFFPCIKSSTAKTAKPPSFSALITRKSSSAEKAIWRSGGTGSVASGVKSVTTSFSFASFWNARRAVSVEARMSASGPAAARTPRCEATARRADVAGGRLSLGHGFGNNFSFFAPSSPRLKAEKPMT